MTSTAIHRAPPALRYTLQDSERASSAWKAACGPHSLAAALGMTLDQVRDILPTTFQGYMNPTMVEFCLFQAQPTYSRRHKLQTQDLCNGINRVQWEGSWLNAGVPIAAAYAHTHWVAHFDGWVLCTACLPAQWIPVDEWRRYHLENKTPFHITHHYLLRRPVAADGSRPSAVSLPS